MSKNCPHEGKDGCTNNNGKGFKSLSSHLKSQHATGGAAPESSINDYVIVGPPLLSGLVGTLDWYARHDPTGHAAALRKGYIKQTGLDRAGNKKGGI